MAATSTQRIWKTKQFQLIANNQVGVEAGVSKIETREWDSREVAVPVVAYYSRRLKHSIGLPTLCAQLPLYSTISYQFLWCCWYWSRLTHYANPFRLAKRWWKFRLRAEELTSLGLRFCEVLWGVVVAAIMVAKLVTSCPCLHKWACSLLLCNPSYGGENWMIWRLAERNCLGWREHLVMITKSKSNRGVAYSLDRDATPVTPAVASVFHPFI